MEIGNDKQSDRNTHHEQRYMMSVGTNLVPDCQTKYLLKKRVNKNVLTITRNAPKELVSDWLTVACPLGWWLGDKSQSRVATASPARYRESKNL